MPFGLHYRSFCCLVVPESNVLDDQYNLGQIYLPYVIGIYFLLANVNLHFAFVKEFLNSSCLWESTMVHLLMNPTVYQRSLICCVTCSSRFCILNFACNSLFHAKTSQLLNQGTIGTMQLKWFFPLSPHTGLSEMSP